MYKLYKQKLDSERTSQPLDHQDMADFLECKCCDKKMAANSERKIVLAVCDLHQRLPTTDLTSSISFYEWKLWTFNFTARDCTKGKTFCYMWHEGIAQRGGNCTKGFQFDDIFDGSVRFC
ncbi:hypothetical protein PR048_021040 [Dryococelus australis]|uniref:Uncharacterized protein n=1 Tax=Dryococelus australis TaxID=614101 RepID=A0ABQ9GX46_9NEOP|nr:hypothetical protein PR048_021040 [Dryococelus australis]